MTKVKLNNREWLLVEGKNFMRNLGIVPGSPPYLYFDDKFGHDGTCEIPLPPGNYGQPVKVSEASEEQAKEIVESDRYYDGPQEQHGLGMVTYYRDYPDELKDSFLFSAKESLNSLVKSQGMKESETVIIERLK